MAEKRMLIMPADTIKKIDENRGDLSQAEFINFLIENQLKDTGTEKQAVSREEILTLIESQLKEAAKKQHYATREDMQSFEQDIKALLKSCLDFFVSYGLELGKHSPKEEFEELSSKLEELENHLNSEGEGKEAKIKWK
jgi:polyhydroxyalkanoate synthesis regulator phasin